MVKITMNIEANEMGPKMTEENLTIESLIKEGEELRHKPSMAKLEGKPFYRQRMIYGNLYWYWCQNYFDHKAGKWKQRTKYIGRKPTDPTLEYHYFKETGKNKIELIDIGMGKIRAKLQDGPLSEPENQSRWGLRWTNG